MDPQFWHEQWERKQIGFHQPQAHPWLSQFWPMLVKGQGQVFVPLCGKSLDMAWLQQHGHSILGIEISPLAITEFFQEQELEPSIRSSECFDWYESNGYQLLCGDFFDLEPRHLDKVEAVYDRAALIALPPDLQARYAKHLLHSLPHRPPILLITFDYDAAEMQGPPFPVSEERVQELFGHAYSIKALSAIDALPNQPGLKSRGLSGLFERVYYLHRV